MTDCPRWMSETKTAIEAGDAERLATAVHTLSGSVANFEAKKVVAAARKLETMAREGNLADAGKTYAILDEEMGRLQEALVAIGAPKRRIKPRKK